MNRKLKRVLDEIRKTEEKLAVWQERLDELNIQREFLENEEIVKSFRALKLDGYTMLETLTGIQNGTVSLLDIGGSENDGKGEAELSDVNVAGRNQDGENMESVSSHMVSREEEQEDRSGK